MNRLIQRSAKCFGMKAYAQQNLLTQVRMMSLMSQRRVQVQVQVQGSLMGFAPIRTFSEEVQEREEVIRYNALKQEIFVTGFDENMT